MAAAPAVSAPWQRDNRCHVRASFKMKLGGEKMARMALSGVPLQPTCAITSTITRVQVFYPLDNDTFISILN